MRYVPGTIIGLLLFSLALFGQSGGRISGIVTDQTGAILPGATVSIIDTERGTTRALTTDAAGEYNAPSLIPGNYTVRVEVKGFKRLDRPGIVLEVGQELRVDLTPQPGDQTQTVTVTEAIPLVDPTSATLGGAVSNAEVNDLPLNGRNYQNLLGLRPGVMLQPGGSPWTQSTNNVRPDETAWMVDGVLNANFFDGRSIANSGSPVTDMASILPIDAIQEFNVMESPKAEYGWKPGAQVNVGVRSGTNTFHGSAYAFGRDDSFDARNAFNEGINPQGVCVPNPGVPAVCNKLPTALEQFGAVVGGRIIKDKLFFFGGYEGVRSTVGNAFAVALPATASLGGDPKNSMPDAIAALTAHGIGLSPLSLKLLGCTASGTCTGGYLPNTGASTSYVSSFPNVNVSDNYLTKMDYNINDKNRVNGMVLVGQYNALGEDHAATNTLFEDTFIQTTWTVGGNWVYTPNARMVNEARFGFDRFVFEIHPADSSTLANGTGYPINTGSGVGGFPSINVTGFDAQAHQILGSQSGRPTDNSPNPFYDFQDAVSYQIGRHSLRFGAEYAHIEGDSDGHDERGVIKFAGNQAFAGSTSLEDFFAGLPTSAALLTGVPNLKVTYESYAGFFQDDFRIVPRLIINLGLRYTYVTPMHEENNQIANFLPTVGLVQQGSPGYGTLYKGDPNDWSPRAGFAYDLTGKGTTVLRGGASIMYSIFNVSTFMGNPGFQAVPGGLSLGSNPTGACTTAVAVGATCPQTFGGTIKVGTAQVPGSDLNWDGVVYPQGATISCTAANPCSYAMINPNIKNPYVTNWNFGIQHAFARDFSLDVAYVGNHGSRLVGKLDINECEVPNNGTCVRPYAAQFPYAQYILESTNDARSNYNSLQTTLTKRVSHGINFTAGYTYGHGLDNGSLNRFGGVPQNSLNPQAEYASSDYDTRHRFTFQATYSLPSHHGLGQVLAGWKLNGIMNLATGQPWLANDQSDNISGSGDLGDRWDFFGNPKNFVSSSSSLPYCTGPGAGGCSTTSGISGIQSFFTSAQSTSMWAQCTAVAPSAATLNTYGCYVKGNAVMVPPIAGTYGTMGRNIFYDPGFKNVDMSLFKDFRFKERMTAEFRFEVFNVFNHVNLANPYGGVVNSAIGNDPSNPSTFGCGCGTPDIINGNPILGSGGSRDIQLGFKFTF
jgi:hypothetical protein